MKTSGAELFAKASKQERVRHLFAFPVGVVIPVFDALYSEPNIQVMLARHEQGAVHAADGYARSSGRPGVCLVTSGPGAINTVRGPATVIFDAVIKVADLTNVPALHRELALIKARARPSQRGEIFQVADVFRVRVLDVGLDCMALELVGSPEKIDDIAATLQRYVVQEIARSGLLSVERGKKRN